MVGGHQPPAGEAAPQKDVTAAVDVVRDRLGATYLRAKKNIVLLSQEAVDPVRSSLVVALAWRGHFINLLGLCCKIWRELFYFYFRGGLFVLLVRKIYRSVFHRMNHFSLV